MSVAAEKEDVITAGDLCECPHRARRHIGNGAVINVGFAKARRFKRYRSIISPESLGKCRACDCPGFRKRKR